MKLKKVLTICTITILALSFISGIGSLDTLILSSPNINQEHVSVTSDFTEHDPIVIPNDYNLSISGWPGSGTENDPYRIEDLEITDAESCITIDDTTLYLEISNCLLEISNPSYYATYGIDLNNVTNCVIRNCTIINARSGILIVSSENCTIEETTTIDVRYGITTEYSLRTTITGNSIDASYLCIEVDQSDDVSIKFNSIHTSGHHAILCQWSDSGIIANNTIDHETSGETAVYLHYCQDTIFANNTIGEDFRIGLHLDDSESGTFHNNSLSGGVRFQYYASPSSSLDFKNNVVRNKPYGYFYNSENISINADEYGQVALVQCDNVTVSNGEFNGVVTPFYLLSSFNCTIKDAIINNTYIESVYIYNSQNCSFLDSSIAFHSSSGLAAESSDYLTIKGNEFSNNHNRNYASIGIYSSDDCVIDSNEISDIDCTGIHLYHTNAIISNNQISSSLQPDLYLYYSPTCEITNNVMQTGIEIESSDIYDWYHTLSGNIVSGRSIGYFTDVSQVDIENVDYHQIIIVNATDVEVVDETAPTSLQAIGIMESSNCDIQGITVDTEYQLRNMIRYCDNISMIDYTQIGSIGLRIYQSDDIVISDSTFNSSFDVAIRTDYAFNISINQCMIASNWYGIYFRDTFNSSITNSIILYNGQQGIYLAHYTGYCAIYENEIGWNGYNARDDGWNNTWDNGVDMGNWWNDYGGSGVYLIRGYSESIDRFPQVLDRYEPPITTTTTTYPTTITTTNIPGSPTVPPLETYTGTEWYLQPILGVPVVTILGGVTGLITLLGVVVVFKRET